MQQQGTGLDVLDKKLVALALQNKGQLETRIRRRMENVRLIWQQLQAQQVPVVQPAGGHCILIDVKQLPQFQAFEHPVASFCAWLYLNTGIRAGAHSVGMQSGTSLNDLVRLAIPVGLGQNEAQALADALVQAFERMENIPELLPNGAAEPGNINSEYSLKALHRLTG